MASRLGPVDERVSALDAPADEPLCPRVSSSPAIISDRLEVIDPADPLVYLVLSVTLLLVAECASFFPARRATRIGAVIALRTE